MFFGVGVSCRNLYSFVFYLYVNGSGSIISDGEERANLSVDGVSPSVFRCTSTPMETGPIDACVET